MKHIKPFIDFINERIYHGTIGAGILPVCTITGRILVGLRSQHVLEPYTWGTFGGKLDIDEGIDETIQDAAMRELEEETLFSGEMKLIPAYVFKDVTFSYHNYFGLIEDEFEPTLNWENHDAVWFTLDELLSMDNKHFGLSALLNDSKSIEMLKNIVKDLQPKI